MPISCDKSILGPWAARKCDMTWTPENSACIGIVSADGEPTAAAWFQDYTGVSIMCHFATTGGLTARFVAAIFAYPFRQLSAEQIVCPVVEDNVRSMQLLRHFGFRPVGRVPDWSKGGDMLFFALRRAECKWLKGRYGEKLGITS